MGDNYGSRGDTVFSSVVWYNGVMVTRVVDDDGDRQDMWEESGTNVRRNEFAGLKEVE